MFDQLTDGKTLNIMDTKKVKVCCGFLSSSPDVCFTNIGIRINDHMWKPNET